LVHGLLNGLATGLYIMSWLDRRRGRHRRGIAISALGYGITVGASLWAGHWYSTRVSASIVRSTP
jgi:hypothetical protein